MSLSNIFKLSYWFGKPLSPSSTALWITGIIFGALIIFGIIAIWRYKVAETGIVRGVWRRFAQWAWTAGIVGWILWLARYERILIFRRRYWLAIWVIGGIVWLWFVLRHARKRVPALHAEARERNYRERYLPVSKKNKKAKRRI